MPRTTARRQKSLGAPRAATFGCAGACIVGAAMALLLPLPGGIEPGVNGVARAEVAKVDGRALVEQAERVYSSKTSAAVLQMQVVTKRYERSYKIVAWTEGRDGDKVLIKILGPASWRGYGTLKVEGVLKLYDPKSNHVSQVSSSMLGDSWMGSHFTNDDLVSETNLAKDFEITVAKSWMATAPFGGARPHHLLVLTPRPRAPVAWGRIEYELFESTEGPRPLRVDYFKRVGDKTAERSLAFADYGQLAGKWIPKTMKATVRAKPGEHTTITYEDLRLDVKIPASKFTEQALRK